MTLNCPLGLNFDWNSRKCYYIDYGIRYDISSYFTWDHGYALQPTFNDLDPSFTLYAHTYVAYPNLTTSVVKFGDLLNLRWHNMTYILEVQLTSTLRANYSLGYNGQVYNHWFFTFNFGTKELRVVRDTDVLDTAYLNLEMMNYIASQTNFQTRIGYLGTLDPSYNEYSSIGFKQLEIFRPPLTFQQTQMIGMKGIRSHLDGFMGLQGGVRSDYNFMLWSTAFFSSTFDLKQRKYVDTNHGLMAFPGIEGCFTGTNKVRITCFEPSSLIVHGATLTLNIANTKISSSFTLQGWFFVKYMDTTSTTDTIIFMKIPNLVTISLKNSLLSLIIEESTAATLPYPPTSVQGNWLHLSVTLQDFTYRLIINRQEVLSYVDPLMHTFDSLAISQLKIYTPNNKLTVMKVKEIVMFGHARDIEEITSDFGAQISRMHHYKQMLFYYPIMETAQAVLNDLSIEGRSTSFSVNANGLYWDFEGRGPGSTDMTQLSTTEEYTGFITRQKSLFFEMGKTVDIIVGALPLSHNSISFSLSVYIAYKDHLVYPVNPLHKTILDIKGASDTLVKLEISQTTLQCIIGDSPTPLQLAQVINQQWFLLICGYEKLTSSAYFQTVQGTTIQTTDVLDTFSVTPLNPTSFSLIINDFEGHLKDLRVFSECLDPATMIKYSRQRLNMLNTEFPLSFGMRMDESLGVEMLETASGVRISMISSNPYLPQWQEPWSTYLVCEGHSRYILTNDYCQFEEKFLRPITPFTFDFTIYEQSMANFTFAMWVLFDDFGTDPFAAFQIILQDRFQWVITTSGVSSVSFGNPSQQLILRDDSKLIGNKGWVLLYTRVVTPFNFVYNHIGVPEANSNPKLDMKGTVLQDAVFTFPLTTLSGLLFTMRFGTNSVIIPRNLQLWNTPFSIEVLKRRVLRSPNPMRFAQNLVALFRFDESGGRTVYNTAGYRHRMDKKMVDNANIRWSHYTYLQVNNLTEFEDMRGFLFCLEPNSRRAQKHCEYYKCHPSCALADCTGPSSDDCVNSTSLINPLTPRDEIAMIQDPTTLESYECNPSCKICTMAFVNAQCLSCVDTLVLNNGVCGQTCPPFEHFIAGTCHQCSNPLCVCDADKLDGCIGCKDPLSDLYLIPRATCVHSCDSREFFDTAFQDCTYCHAYCGTCFGATYQQCLTCRDTTNFYLIEMNTCLPKQCPTGSRFDASGLYCLDCEHPCAECSGVSTRCTKCVKEYAFDGANQCVLCVDIEGYDFPWIEDDNYPGGGKCTEICGDGKNFGNYQCDDGNVISGDGCSEVCMVEPNYECNGGSPSSKDICTNKKGPRFEITHVNSDNSQITITFDKSVNTKLKYFDKETLIFKINGRDITLQEGMDYKLISKVQDSFFDKKRLVIQFNPQFVIKSGDQLEIGFKDAYLITDQNGNPLNQTLSDQFRLSGFDPVGESGEIKMIRKIAEGVASGSKFTMQTNFVLSLIMGKALEKLWLAINSCQIIYFMPLMNIPFPKILVTALKYLEFTNVDIEIDTQPFFYKYIHIEEIKDKAVAQSYIDYGYPSSIFFLSYSDKMQVWIFVLALYPLLFVLSLLLKHPIFNILRKLEKGYRFNMIIRFLIELYLEMTLHAFMNIYSLQYSTMTRALVSFIALAFMAFLTYFPAMCIALIQEYSRDLKKESVKASMGELYEDTLFVENKLLNQMYIAVFLFRRLVYVLILVLLKDYPQIQVALCILKTVAILWFMIKQMPFRQKLVNYQNIMNETLIGVAFSICYVFKKDMDESERNRHGYVIIAIVVIIITFNVIVVLIETIANFVAWIKQVIQAGGIKAYYKAKLKEALTVKVKPLPPQFLNNEPLKTTQHLKNDSIISDLQDGISQPDQSDISMLRTETLNISELRKELHLKNLSTVSAPELQSREHKISHKSIQQEDLIIQEQEPSNRENFNNSFEQVIEENYPNQGTESIMFEQLQSLTQPFALDADQTFRKDLEEIAQQTEDEEVDPNLVYIQDIRRQEYLERQKQLIQDEQNNDDLLATQTMDEGRVPKKAGDGIKVRKRVNQTLRIVRDSESEEEERREEQKRVKNGGRQMHKLKVIRDR